MMDRIKRSEALSRQNRRHFVDNIGRSLLAVSLGVVLRPDLQKVFAKQGDADSAAIACLQQGDIQCAIDIFEEAFAQRPYDDAIRENLVLSLIVDALRNIDKGLLANAQKSVDRATELNPNDTRLSYLIETLNEFDRIIWWDTNVSKSRLQ